MAKIDFMKIASRAATKTIATGGAMVGTRALSVKLMPNVNPLIKGLGAIAIGAFAPQLLSKKEASVFHDAGAGMIAAGALELAEKFMPAMVTPVSEVAVQGIGESAYVIDEDFEQVSGDDSPISGEENESPII